MQTHAKRFMRTRPNRILLSKPHFTSIIKLIAVSNKTAGQAYDREILNARKLTGSEPCTNKDHLNYIIVPPDSLKMILPGDNDTLIYMESIRTKGLNYQNATEDKFLDQAAETADEAFVYYQEIYQCFFVHVPRNGRLYLTENLFEVCDILRSVKANEDSKLIK